MSGHYNIPISWPPLDRGKFYYILYLNQINKKNKAKKFKIATKLDKKFSHPRAKKLCDLIKRTGFKDAEFMDILRELPLTCL